MHRLIENAKGAVDQAELYWKRTHTVDVSYQNNQLQEIAEDDLSSVALRVIHQGKLGSTFAVSPEQDGLIDQAKTAAAYGDRASFSFAPAADFPQVEALNPQTAELRSEDLVELCEATRDAIRASRDDLALGVSGQMQKQTLTVETTEGANAYHESAETALSIGAPIKGAGIGVYRWTGSVSPLSPPQTMIDEFLEWYGWTEKTSTPATGKLPVLFAPDASFLYLLPLWAGLEGGALEKRTSPITDRLGDQILSEKLTVMEDSISPGSIGARPFDDEGVPCQRRAIIENGVLRTYLLDQRTASALGQTSTGNAVKRELFGEGTETKPTPWPIRWMIPTGTRSYRDIVADLDEALLLYYGMGFHSGNYPQGQFSIQAIGFHIRSGEVVGRLENTMVSANIYEDFQHVREISSEQGNALGFLNVRAPYILVDSVQVAGL